MILFQLPAQTVLEKKFLIVEVVNKFQVSQNSPWFDLVGIRLWLLQANSRQGIYIGKCIQFLKQFLRTQRTLR